MKKSGKHYVRRNESRRERQIYTIVQICRIYKSWKQRQNAQWLPEAGGEDGMLLIKEQNESVTQNPDDLMYNIMIASNQNDAGLNPYKVLKNFS